MRAGTFLPHIGALASADAIKQAAQHAEALDYDCLWVAERLLYPLAPKNPYPGMPEGSQLPEHFRTSYQPIEALTFAAALTSKIRLGTSVLNMPYHNPVMLARRLATLDALSGGRLNVGLGQAWSKDELAAMGAATTERAARAEEFVAVLRAMWGPDPVEYHGRYFQVPASDILPKPIQQPSPPIYMAGYVPAALDRVARLSDGWLPSGVPLAYTTQMMDAIRQQAVAAGRDPAALELLVLGFVTITDAPLGEGRSDFTGSLDELRRDVETARELGATELILIPPVTPTVTVDDFRPAQETIRALF